MLLDATAVPGDRSGVGQYVAGLIEALGATDIRLAVVCQRPDAERLGRLAPSADILPGPAGIAHRPARLAWEQEGLPLLAEQVNADVLHSPAYTMPLHSPVPVVVTIHDVTSFTEPDLTGSMRAAFYRSATRAAVRRSSRVIVPSAATRDELVRVLEADPDSIDVVPHGVDLATFHPPSEAEVERVSDRLGLHGRPYVAFLGVLARRKNVPDLVRGWAAAVEDLEQPPALVLAGSSGADDEVEDAIARVPAQLRVVRPGFLHRADLPGLLGGATVVAYASTTEGFGLPVLEAMACGAAVLATRRRSLPEVGGDAVDYADPDAAGIAACLSALLGDADRRAALAARGRERAREFTWEASAAAHERAYELAVAGVPV